MKKSISLFTVLLMAAGVWAQEVSTSATLHVNNINTKVYQLGYLSYDGSVANYTVGGGNSSTIFANGLWIGGTDINGQRHLVARCFGMGGSDWFPGPLTTDGSATTSEEVVNAFNRVWHVTRDMIDYHIAHFGDAGYEPAEAIATWPGNGPEGYAAQLAPYYDANGDGLYTPATGDYPLIRGDEAVFCIFNDAYDTHTESYGEPLGVEVHCMTYAFNEPQDPALWNTVFIHYDIYSRTTSDLDDTYMGAWTDFDLGYAYDDYMGCDVMRGMYYAYNGKETDGPGTGSFQGVPPAQGCIILGGPALPTDGLDNPAISVANFPEGFTPGDTLGNMGINGLYFGDGVADNERMGMISFIVYENSVSVTGEPSYANDYYNYMRACWKNSQHMKYGGNGVSSGPTTLDANFMFPGDSDPWHWGTDGVVPDINPDDWSEVTAGNYPNDRRGVAASGPFHFAVGSSQQLDLAYTTAFGESSAWSSVEALRLSADDVRRQFVRDTTDSGRPFTYRPQVGGPDGVDRVEEGASLSVWPNPTSGRLTVALPQGGEVQLYDMVGRKLLSARTADGVLTLDLQELPQGVYLLRSAGKVQRIVKK